MHAYASRRPLLRLVQAACSMSVVERVVALIGRDLSRNLQDKLYEKRKAAALELEAKVRDGALDDASVDLLLLYLDGQCQSDNPHTRKGGLIGLAAVTIGLKTKEPRVPALIAPVLRCFQDFDSRVRYYACEALYNMAKALGTLVMPVFDEAFAHLSRVVADPDANVRSGAMHLDRLLKDIVQEANRFELDRFMPLLRHRIADTNPLVRVFLLNWITTLQHVPDVDLLGRLADFLGGVFVILTDSKNGDARKAAEETLEGFLKELPTREGNDYPALVQIVLRSCSSSDTLTRAVALQWLTELLPLGGLSLLGLIPEAIQIVLTALSYTADEIRSRAATANSAMQALVRTCAAVGAANASDGATAAPAAATASSEAVDGAAPAAAADAAAAASSKAAQFKSYAVLSAVTQLLASNLVPTREAALLWIEVLLESFPNDVFQHIDETFPALLKTLCDPHELVLVADLRLLGKMSLARDSFFDRFMADLVCLFATDQELLEQRITPIVCGLATLVDGQRVYLALAAQLVRHTDDMRFVAIMLHSLSLILLTTEELHPVRQRIQACGDLDTSEAAQRERVAGRALFAELFRTWMLSAVPTLLLCLLAQNYSLSSAIVNAIGSHVDVSVSVMMQLDRLILLLESPTFSKLRLRLLNPRASKDLIFALHGILMLLPQSEAYRTLVKRLKPVGTLAQIIELADESDGRTADSAENAVFLQQFVEKQMQLRPVAAAIADIFSPLTVSSLRSPPASSSVVTRPM